MKADALANPTAAVTVYLTPGGDGHVRVPDAATLFGGHYGRHGSDLVITGQDGADRKSTRLNSSHG